MDQTPVYPTATQPVLEFEPGCCCTSSSLRKTTFSSNQNYTTYPTFSSLNIRVNIRRFQKIFKLRLDCTLLDDLPSPSQSASTASFSSDNSSTLPEGVLAVGSQANGLSSYARISFPNSSPPWPWLWVKPSAISILPSPPTDPWSKEPKTPTPIWGRSFLSLNSLDSTRKALKYLGSPAFRLNKYISRGSSPRCRLVLTWGPRGPSITCTRGSHCRGQITT